MKKINENITSYPLIKGFLERQKTTYTKEEVLGKIGRFLTFRELQLLHRNKEISDAELGFYIDMKACNCFTENQVLKIQAMHNSLK